MNEELFSVWNHFHSELDSLFMQYSAPGGGPSSREQREFTDVITMCNNRGWNVYEYVRYAIGVAARDHRILKSKDLADREMRSAYQAFQSRDKDNDEVKDQSVASTDYADQYTKMAKWVDDLCRRSPSMYPSKAHALQTVNLPLEAWFRICHLMDTPQRLYDSYGELGWRQIRESRRLLGTLRQIAPVQLHNLELEFGSFGPQ